MPRKISKISEFIEGYRAFSEGKRGQKIHEHLRKLFKYNIPSLRAVGDWTERYKALHEDSPEEKELGQTVEWHRLDEMGFEWEASRGALAHYKAFGYMPTKRALKWWYRLSLLGDWKEGDVDIYKDAEYHGSLLYWARSYEEQEIQELFGIETKSMKELDEQLFKERKEQ